MVDLYPKMIKITPKSIYETMKKDGTKLEWFSGLLYAKKPCNSCWTILAHKWFDGGCLYYTSTSMSALPRTFSSCCCFARPCVHKQKNYTCVNELLTGRGWSETQSECFAECQQNRTTVNIIEWHGIQCSDSNRPYLLSVPYITLEKLHSVVWRQYEPLDSLLVYQILLKSLSSY